MSVFSKKWSNMNQDDNIGKSSRILGRISNQGRIKSSTLWRGDKSLKNLSHKSMLAR